MATPLEKWMGWASPLARGRFDFFTTPQSPIRWNTLYNGLGMTGGRFWVRVSGGANLRRGENGNIPTFADPIVGIANGNAAEIFDDGGLVAHADGSRFVYGLSVVGAMGVEEPQLSAIREVVFAAGDWVGSLPNPALGVTVTPIDDGSFNIVWRYDPRGQHVRPDHFAVYQSAKDDPDIDYSTPIDTVDFVEGVAEYLVNVGVKADATPGKYRFGVRAVSADGAEEKNIQTDAAWNTTTAPYDTIKTFGESRALAPSSGPKS